MTSLTFGCPPRFRPKDDIFVSFGIVIRVKMKLKNIFIIMYTIPNFSCRRFFLKIDAPTEIGARLYVDTFVVPGSAGARG